MKTLGAQSARLVAALNDRSSRIFTLQEAAGILGAPPNVVSNLLGKAERRGIVTRLRRGIYTLVPSEMGSETSYVGDPLAVADRLLGARPHFLSHGTALAIHGMTIQPRIVVTVSAVDPPSRSIMAQGIEIRIVGIRTEEIFGVTDRWVDGPAKVAVSDPERTLVDCLRRPELCGGYAEADLGAWMVRERLCTRILVDHALRLGVGAVIARTGHLLDSCQIGTEDDRGRLRKRLTRTYHLLDPSLPPEGRYDGRWRLRLNVDPDVVEAQRSS